jgi:hypothetical protein
LIGVVLVSGTACESEAPQGDGPYAAEILAASKVATSDFERSVLSDGMITRAEYEESVQRLVSCGKDRGITISPIAQGEVYNYSFPLTDTSDAVMTECSAGTTMVIETIYSNMVRNPAKGDYEALVASCLARSGLAPSGYDKSQYLADRSAVEKDGVLTADFPFDPEDPRLAECESDPESH